MAGSLTDDFSDLIELGIDETGDDSLTAKFDKCTSHVQTTLASALDNGTLLKLYAFYKQGTEGPCDRPKPSWYDMRGKAKWDSWKTLGNMSKREAKSRYIEQVLAQSPDFSFDEAGNKSDNHWVRVSSMVQEENQPLDKNICDYIRSGDVKNVTEFIKSNPNCKNWLDESGMGMIHYASDIGNPAVLNLLIYEDFDLNLQDSEGQTALHYAASCGHVDCVKLLLSKGAKREVLDREGCTARDVSCDVAVKELFK